MVAALSKEFDIWQHDAGHSAGFEKPPNASQSGAGIKEMLKSLRRENHVKSFLLQRRGENITAIDIHS